VAEKLVRLSQVNLRLRRGPVVIGDVLYAAGGMCGPRSQRDYQLVVIHRGDLNLRLDRERIRVPENHGILLSPSHREHFFFSVDRTTHHSWCAIDPHAVPLEMRGQLQRLRGPVPFIGRMAALLDMARKTIIPSQEEEVLQSGFYLGLGLALMCDFAAAVRDGKSSASKTDAALCQMEHFIAEACTGPLTLRDIARAVGVSRQHLLKLCRAGGKPTPMQQLYAKRLEIAADLLLHTGFSMGEISDQCGFVNSFHFSRRFKQAYGRSPLAWRSEHWKVARIP
jgi:AraC family transcriptional regulator of arabinose operon